eukprot:c5072_g1_i1.p1 GENE.c5072_g1_i1~~c5072_g1_i1.p1  ORF type:complete len:323 (+),score=70.90 c5072_g1_i1:56-1024(+)
MLLRSSTFAILILLFVCTESRRFKSDFDPRNDLNNYNRDVLMMSALRDFNLDCARKGIPAEFRYELLVAPNNFTNFLTSYRQTAQLLTGPVHEGFAVYRMLRLVWSVYGFAVTPVSALQTALSSLSPFKNWQWLEPYAGTGYLAMQIKKTLQVNITAWDQKSYDQKWVPIQIVDSQKAPLDIFNVMLLSYPCSQDRGCWDALARFEASQNSRVVVYAGEPRNHCCGDSEMWEHLCVRWNLRIAHSVEGGLPGSYNYLLVFVKRSLVPPTCGGDGNEAGPECFPTVECSPGLNCPHEQSGPLGEFVSYCNKWKSGNSSKILPK